MTQIKTLPQEAELRPEDAEVSLRNMVVCVERAARIETLKLVWDLGVRLDLGRNVQEIMGRQV